MTDNLPAETRKQLEKVYKKWAAEKKTFDESFYSAWEIDFMAFLAGYEYAKKESQDD